MNKLDFLRRLNKELGMLDEQEKREILAFYEERFYSGTIYENKTEEEVISELETPEVIARNVLEEYGVSPKYVKTKEERYTGIDSSKLIILVLFDIFIASWLIPTLYSIVVAIFGSSLSYIGLFGLMFGEQTVTEEFLFAFGTAAYILLFLFGLVVLELTLYVTKKIIIYHLNVLKFKNRDKISRKLHRFSVDGWFKRHRTANTLKTVFFVGALVALVYSGYNLFKGEVSMIDQFTNTTQITDVYSEDLSTDIAGDLAWDIVTDFENMQVEIIPVLGTELVVTHKYVESEDFEIDINIETNTLTISNDFPNVSFWFDIDSLYSIFGEGNVVYIEVPVDLILDDVDVDTMNGAVTLIDVEVKTLDITTLNGAIRLDSITVGGNVNVETSNGEIYIKEVVGSYELVARTSNGRIILRDLEFIYYGLDTSNGGIDLKNLNVENQDGLELIADTSNGSIELVDVYVKDVQLDTSNGDIDYHNEDSTFELDNFEADTSNGDVSENID